MNTAKLSELLGNKRVREYVVHFLPEPTTITKVAEKVGVKNKRILTDMIRYLRYYKMDKRTYRFKHSKPIQLDASRLVSDYMYEIFNLDDDGKNSLFIFISEDTINKFLVKNNRDLDQLLNKLILWIIKVDTLTKMEKIIDPVYVSDFDSLLYEDYRSPEKWELEQALKKFAKYHQKGFAFIDKIKKSNMTTSINIKNLYELINGNLKDYQQRLEFRLRTHNRLREDSNLIFDPYTNILEKRTDFKKRKT